MDCAAHGKAVDGIHVDAAELLFTGEQLASLLITLRLRLVGFQDCEDPASWRVGGKARLKSVRFFAMVLGGEHSSDDRYLRIRRDELCHEFGCQAAVQFGIHTDNGRAAT